MTRYALYATTYSGLTFRLGLPVDLNRAHARWQRLDDRRLYSKRAQRVRFDSAWHLVKFFEVRAVDAAGRGLGSERHHLAFPVPFRACRLSKRDMSKRGNRWVNLATKALA